MLHSNRPGFNSSKSDSYHPESTLQEFVNTVSFAKKSHLKICWMLDVDGVCITKSKNSFKM
jgi:hypothetical protein